MTDTMLQPPSEPYDPEIVEAKLATLVKVLDELQTDEAARPLHDFMQDSLMPLVAMMQKEITTLTYYLGMHEDRLAELEEETSRLLPEDAEPIRKFIEKTVDLFEQLLAKGSSTQKSLPGLEKMIETGKELIEMIDDITIDVDEDDDKDDGPAN